MTRWSKYTCLVLLSCALLIPAHAQDEVLVSPDRPGFGTGSEVLGAGCIQWETGFECLHILGTHILTLPTTLFRFGVHRRVELRMEYTGVMAIFDHPDDDPASQDEQLYTPEHLLLGTKILLWDHRGGTLNQAWVPRTSVLCYLGLPMTTFMAQTWPVVGSIDFLFENNVTDWLSIGYDLGVRWNDWAPTPDIFASLGLNFAPTDRLGLFIESYNIFDPDATELTTGKTYTHCHVNLDFGLTYAVHPRVQLDAYAGFNVYNSEQILSQPQNYAFFGFGVTWLISHRPQI